MDRANFVELCGGSAAAIETETQLLSVGSEFLPPAAQRVRDGGAADAEYWIWACAQVAKMREEEEEAR